MKAQARAYQKNIRQTPRKVRLLADVVRGMKTDDALEILSANGKKSADVISKVLTQAVANLTENNTVKPESISISEIMVEDAGRMRRWRPVSRGRAHPYTKRMSHLRITVQGEAVEQTTSTKK